LLRGLVRTISTHSGVSNGDGFGLYRCAPTTRGEQERLPFAAKHFTRQLRKRYVSRYTPEDLKRRAFERAAWVLEHHWEEQKNMLPRAARVHSRIFDTLIHSSHILYGVSIKGTGHTEHLVPCSLIRDQAFKMFWDGKDVGAVALMLQRTLKIAHITKEEARLLDYELRYKTTMPDGWCFETGSVTERLDVAGIKLTLVDPGQ
jgi:hypothetical protein